MIRSWGSGSTLQRSMNTVEATKLEYKYMLTPSFCRNRQMNFKKSRRNANSRKPHLRLDYLFSPCRTARHKLCINGRLAVDKKRTLATKPKNRISLVTTLISKRSISVTIIHVTPVKIEMIRRHAATFSCLDVVGWDSLKVRMAMDKAAFRCVANSS